jgi:hypothetical protein
MKSNNEELIINSERALAKAHISMDLAIIDELLHKDYTIVQPGGKIETKQEVLDSYKTGDRHWDEAEVDELDVIIYGEMARVVGLWRAAGINNGESFNYRARFISIWIKEQGEWKNISYASSAL